MEGNTNRLLHDELLYEHYVQHERYKDILELSNRQLRPTRNMTCIRAYALSQQGKLSDQLFAQQNNLTSQYLLPQLNDSLRPANMPARLRQHLNGFPLHDMSVTNFLRYKAQDTVDVESTRNYLLCALLLDRLLPEFADSIKSFYVPQDSSRQAPSTEVRATKTKKNKNFSTPIHLKNLPKHYAEALILHQHQYAQTSIIYDDSQLIADFISFNTLHHQHLKLSKDNLNLFLPYVNTYWFYYYYR